MDGKRTTEPSIGVVVVTHRAREHLGACLPPLLASPLRPRVLVVNSSSGDGTVESARALGAETLVVPRHEFNHGLTRERARRHLGTDIVVMLTPDAYATDPGFIERLTAPLRRGEAAIAYGRQMARPDAGLVERCGRDFSYPGQSHIRSLADRPSYGSYVHFCSNACAAWLSSALDEVGGFRATLVSEETIATAALLRRGHRIANVADAAVRHSHPLSVAGEFTRHFDIGYSRRWHADLLLAERGDGERGRRFARLVLRRTLGYQPAALPRVLAQLAAKWLGYRIGLLGPALPAALARQLSGQDYFWSSEPVGGQPERALATA